MYNESREKTGRTGEQVDKADKTMDHTALNST